MAAEWAVRRYRSYENRLTASAALCQAAGSPTEGGAVMRLTAGGNGFLGGDA